MAKNLSSWGTAVKVEMVRRGWSNKDLADAVHLSREYVSAIVNGRVISPVAAKAISEAVGVEAPASPSDFIVQQKAGE